MPMVLKFFFFLQHGSKVGAGSFMNHDGNINWWRQTGDGNRIADASAMQGELIGIFRSALLWPRPDVLLLFGTC